MSELASPPSGSAVPAGSAGGRTARVPAQTRPEDVPTQPTTEPPTGPGTMIAGRYRLRTKVGSDPAASAAEFWLAEDTILRRDVAVTVLRKLTADVPHGPDRADAMIARALRSGSFEHSGCARLLDVFAPGADGLPADVNGAAVTEWVPGKSLAEAVTEGLLKPMVAARAVAPLAAAAEAAHRRGLVLGCDHPQRVRISPDGRAQLCFALPRPESTPADDVRGLGAVLHTLLTSRWPLSGADAARAGITSAERTARGGLVAPATLRPGVPVELDTLARGTLGPESAPGHVHTAAAVHRLLSEVVAEDDRTALFPPADDGVPSGPGDVWQDRGRKVTVQPDPERKRKLTIGLIALGIGLLIVLGFVGTQIGSLFSDGSGRPPIVVGSVPAQESEPTEAGGTDGPVTAVDAEVFAAEGEPDNAGRVSRVRDDDPATGWRTSTYRQQFPAYKPGLGVMFSFVSAQQLSELTITSRTPGTVVEIRSASSAEAKFEETSLITQVTLGDGPTTVSLAGSQPMEYLLVWITKLGGGGSEFASEINEVTFMRAGA